MKALVKKMTSNGQKSLTHKTLTDKRKYAEMHVEGMPVVWTNSMDTIEDTGDQILNRFFILNVDESLVQSQTVEHFQKIEEMYGTAIDSETLSKGRTAVGWITERGGFDVLNPFAEFISQKNYTALNRRPMLKTLLSAITYASWRWRPMFEEKDKTFLLSTLADNYRAIDLWNRNATYQELKIPDYLRKLLDILDPSIGMTKGEMAAAYFEKHGIALSADTCYNYAKKLEEKNLATSSGRRDGDGQSHGLEWRSTISTINVVEVSETLCRDSLAKIVRNYTTFAGPLYSAGQNEPDLEEIVGRLLDAELPAEKMRKEQGRMSPQTTLTEG